LPLLGPIGEIVATLERAIAIATKAHEGQVDKAGAPYILHPLRVMLHVATIEERIAAVLHIVPSHPAMPVTDCIQISYKKLLSKMS
jgi:(p)ppGpp synthase/HD superfamily hydrolase